MPPALPLLHHPQRPLRLQRNPQRPPRRESPRQLLLHFRQRRCPDPRLPRLRRLWLRLLPLRVPPASAFTVRRSCAAWPKNTASTFPRFPVPAPAGESASLTLRRPLL